MTSRKRSTSRTSMTSGTSVTSTGVRQHTHRGPAARPPDPAAHSRIRRITTTARRHPARHRQITTTPRKRTLRNRQLTTTPGSTPPEPAAHHTHQGPATHHPAPAGRHQVGSTSACPRRTSTEPGDASTRPRQGTHQSPAGRPRVRKDIVPQDIRRARGPPPDPRIRTPHRKAASTTQPRRISTHAARFMSLSGVVHHSILDNSPSHTRD